MTTKVEKIIEIYSLSQIRKEYPLKPITVTYTSPQRKIDAILDLAKATWEEGEHPRAKDGKFGDKGSGEAAKPKGKPVAGQNTSQLSTGGKIAAANAKFYGARNSVSAISDFAFNNNLFRVGEKAGAFGDVGAIKDWKGVQELVNRIKPYAEKAGVGKEFDAMVTKERIAHMRFRAKGKAEHDAIFHSSRGAASLPPKNASLAKPVTVKPKDVLGMHDDFTDPEDQKMANEVYHNAARDAYLEIKGQIGRDDELYAKAQEFAQKSVRNKAEFVQHLKELNDICLQRGARTIDTIFYRNRSHEKFDRERKERIEAATHMSIPNAPTTQVLPEVAAKLPATTNRLVTQFRENKLTSKKKTDKAGVNADNNYTVTIEDDGRAIMKGISRKKGTNYGMPASEVCAYEASVLMGFDCMQPTAHRMEDGKPQSVQEFVENGIHVDRMSGTPKQTPELLDSVSQMVAFDFGMANRDRNMGNWMLDSNNTMRGIDNGLVGIEAGRGEIKNRDVVTNCNNNCRAYCYSLTGSPDFKGLVEKKHVDAVETFVNSPAFDKLVTTHYGPGTQGGADLAKRGISIEDFKNRWRDGCNYGIKKLRDLI